MRLFFLGSISLYAQKDIPPKMGFGDFFQVSSSLGYFAYETELLNVYNILYSDHSVSIPLNRHFSFGLNYNHIFVSDSFQEKNTFFRAGAFMRFSEYSFSEKFIFSGDIIGSYGNFVIEIDEKLNKRNVYYAGIRMNIEYELFSRFFIIGGLKFIRQLEKGDYGLENYPYLGFAYSIPTRSK